MTLLHAVLGYDAQGGDDSVTGHRGVDFLKGGPRRACSSAMAPTTGSWATGAATTSTGPTATT